MSKNWLITLLLLAALSGNAQVISLVDDCNPLVRSLTDVVFIVRSDYALQDKDEQLFGKNGKDYFGSGYGAAINLEGRLIFSENTYKPYLTDTSYRSYGSEYVPVPTDLFYKNIGKKAMEPLTAGVEGAKGHVTAAISDSASMANTEVARDDSLACVVVTFVPAGKGTPDDTPFRLSYLNNGVEWEGTTGVLANTNLGSDAAFGLLFYEKIGHGQVHYVFGGFVEKISGAWQAIKFEQLMPLQKSGKEEKNKSRGRKN